MCQAQAQAEQDVQLNGLQMEVDKHEVAATEAAAALKVQEEATEEAATEAAAVLKAKNGAAEEIAELESRMKEEKSKHRWIVAINAAAWYSLQSGCLASSFWLGCCTVCPLPVTASSPCKTQDRHQRAGGHARLDDQGAQGPRLRAE